MEMTQFFFYESTLNNLMSEFHFKNLVSRTLHSLNYNLKKGKRLSLTTLNNIIKKSFLLVWTYGSILRNVIGIEEVDQ
jgi:hypothetical protein